MCYATLHADNWLKNVFHGIHELEIKGRQSKNNRPIFPSNFAKNELSRRTPQYFGVISFSHSLPVESFLRIEQVDFRNTKTKNDTIKIF